MGIDQTVSGGGGAFNDSMHMDTSAVITLQ